MLKQLHEPGFMLLCIGGHFPQIVQHTRRQKVGALLIAVWLFGYGSPLHCGCVRTVCRFHAAAYA